MWWSNREDATLAVLVNEGADEAVIASQLRRSPSAIQSRTSRLRKAGVIVAAKRVAPPQTLAMIERIRELAAPAELSASQIGDAVSLTRNAVIGLCRRHGIKLRAAGTRPPGQPAPKPHRKPAPPRVIAPAVIVDLDEYRPPAPICEAVVPDPEPSEPVAFMDLRNGQCRWIERLPDGLETLYCGCRTLPGKSWCRTHFARAFDLPATRASSRKSRRRAA